MDISLFKNLFLGLSQLSPTSYEIWDARGPVFSSRPHEKNSALQKQIRGLSARIIRGQQDGNETLANNTLAVGVPIQNRNETVGALIAYGENAKASLGPAMKTFLFSLAEIIQDHLISKKEVEKITEELSQSFEDIYLYSTIGTQVKTLRFSTAMLNDLVGQILETMRADMAFAQFPDRPQFNAILNPGIPAGKISDLQGFINGILRAIPPDAPSLAENYFILNDSRQMPDYMTLGASPYRFLGVKIQSAEYFYGWLGLVSFNLKEIFRLGEMRLLISVAEQVAAVIRNTDLYLDLERFGVNMVKSLVYAIEAKDPYTRGHAERVNQYCLWISQKMELDPEKENILKWASILHDIGKIGIPESILNKQAKLTDEEYEVIKSHPEKGRNIIKPLEQLSGSVPGVLHHHERFDGTGYPYGLMGEEIPFIARIIAVADTFDAINSDRAYRAAKPPEVALAIIEESSGTQLDPEIVKVFREVVSARLLNNKQEVPQAQ
ncbi:MAG: HD-GYP domain-containing protein [Desulfobacterales bacterium]|nr:HD-GYP domain-containing protein [Desulfobacterales bacterium]